MFEAQRKFLFMGRKVWRLAAPAKRKGGSGGSEKNGPRFTLVPDYNWALNPAAVQILFLRFARGSGHG